MPTRTLGQKAGDYEVTLGAANVPPHVHNIRMPCDSEEGSTDDPSNAFLAVRDVDQYSPNQNDAMQAFDSSSVGGGLPFDIQNPFQAINFIIALEGIFPSRN